MTNTNLLISYKDYQRITSTIHSVLKATGIKDNSSMYYAMAGMFILKTHYQLDCNIVAGSALFNIGADDSTLFGFGNFESQGVNCGSSGYYAWIEAKSGEDTIVLDFMAPLFNQALREVGSDINCPQKMFQKNKATMSFEVLDSVGDYVLVENKELTRQQTALFTMRLDMRDIVEIITMWYKKPRYRMGEIMIGTDRGEQMPVKYTTIKLNGAW